MNLAIIGLGALVENVLMAELGLLHIIARHNMSCYFLWDYMCNISYRVIGRTEITYPDGLMRTF